MDPKGEQYYPTYRFEHRDVVLAEFESALAIANDQTRHYGLLANILLAVLALAAPLFLQTTGENTPLLRFARDNQEFLLLGCFLFSLIVLRYFTELQKQIVFNARKVVTLRLLLGLDYGTIHLTLPNWRVEGATNPFAIPLFPRWISFGSVPFWTLLVANTLFAWTVLASYEWPAFGVFAIVLSMAWFYRWSLHDRHETTRLIIVMGLAWLLRLRLMENFEYLIYRAKLSVVELDRLKVNYEALRKVAVGIEDRRFYEHGGIDWKAFGRAVLSRFAVLRKRYGYIRSGGSTLPMQLVRTLFIAHGQPAWKRKFFELLLAPWISKQFTKSEVLAMYLASVRYERGVMGLTKAIKHFFGGLQGHRLSNEEAFLLIERLSNATSSVNMKRVHHLMDRAGLPLEREKVDELYRSIRRNH